MSNLLYIFTWQDLCFLLWNSKKPDFFSKWKAKRRFSRRANIFFCFLFAESLWSVIGENLQARKAPPSPHFLSERGILFSLRYKLQWLSFCSCIPEKEQTNTECFNLTNKQQQKPSNTSINMVQEFHVSLQMLRSCKFKCIPQYTGENTFIAFQLFLIKCKS